MAGTTALLLFLQNYFRHYYRNIIYIYNIINNTILPLNYSWYTFVFVLLLSTVADYIFNDLYGSQILLISSCFLEFHLV